MPDVFRQVLKIMVRFLSSVWLLNFGKFLWGFKTNICLIYPCLLSGDFGFDKTPEFLKFCFWNVQFKVGWGCFLLKIRLEDISTNYLQGLILYRVSQEKCTTKNQKQSQA